MQNLDKYIPELNNKDKIWNITEKLVHNELKIDKYESKRLIIKMCILEMENKMFKLHKKSVKFPNNQKIKDEVEDTENKLRKGIRALNDLNDKISRREIALIRLKQEKQKEIKKGLKRYIKVISYKYEKLRQECTGDTEQNKDCRNELEKMEKELSALNSLLG